MNRFSRESAPPIRRRKPGAAAQLLLRRGEAKDESLDLFSAIRRSESPTISSSSSVAAAAAAAAAAEEGELGRRSGVDDDLFYVDVGKSDYDWLLTPPGTPLFSSSQPSSASAKSAPSVRSASSTKPSKLSVSSPPEINTIIRSGRTVSAASSSASSNCTSSTPLSTAKSSLSVTSKLSPSPRQTTMRPINTPTPTSTCLPSPARIRHKPSPPSTPIPRPRAPSTASSPRTVAPASRPNPRQSTPTRSASVGRSAGAPARAAVQPDAMSKIKTKPTERPQSTGKQRSVTPASSNRGRIQENSTKKANPIETKRPSASNTAIRISAKPSSSSSPPVESNGFGRNISKKSLDVAVRHTDIRQGAGGIRGASLFPHSIRSTAAKSRPIPATNKVALPTTTTTTTTTTTADNGSSLDRAASECGSSTNGTISGERAKTDASVSGDSTTTSTKSQERKFTAARVSELDLYGISTRYDTMLLKEDARNLNWLRSVDDVSAESPTFHRFEPLPEPFGLV